MQDQERAEYMEAVLSEKVHPTDPVEQRVLANLKNTLQALGQTGQQVQLLEQQLNAVRAEFQRLIGRRDSYTDLLTEMEDARRQKLPPGTATPPGGMTLEDFGKSIGAEKVEAVDLHGNRLEETKQ